MKNLFFVIIILTIAACSKKNADLTQFKWMVGHYQAGNDSVKIFEEWADFSDSSMIGKGTVIFKTDTVFSEKIMLHVKNDSIYYQVTGAGNVDVVDFKFTEIVKDTFVFENPAHDFPKKIIYVKTADGMYAKVDGINKGIYHKEEFNFKRLISNQSKLSKN